MAQATKYAVVTGANKGIGFEIVRQLASNNGCSITKVLTARDEKRGLEAVEKLNREFGISSSSSGNVVFHQLDITDPASVSALADFVKTQFGKLDILVNSAGINEVIYDPTVPVVLDPSDGGSTPRILIEAATHTYDLAEAV